MMLFRVLLLVTPALAGQSFLDKGSKCVGQPWELHNLTIFTAEPTSDTGSFIYFSFIDTNFNVSRFPVTCGFRLDVGKDNEENSLLGYDWMRCVGGQRGNGTIFRYNGTELKLARTSVECGSGFYFIEGTMSVSSVPCKELKTVVDTIITGEWCQAEDTLSITPTLILQNGIYQPLLSTTFLPSPLPSSPHLTSAAERSWSLGVATSVNLALIVITAAVFAGSLTYMS